MVPWDRHGAGRTCNKPALAWEEAGRRQGVVEEQEVEQPPCSIPLSLEQTGTSGSCASGQTFLVGTSMHTSKSTRWHLPADISARRNSPHLLATTHRHGHRRCLPACLHRHRTTTPASPHMPPLHTHPLPHAPLPYMGTDTRQTDRSTPHPHAMRCSLLFAAWLALVAYAWRA